MDHCLLARQHPIRYLHFVAVTVGDEEAVADVAEEVTMMTTMAGVLRRIPIGIVAHSHQRLRHHKFLLSVLLRPLLHLLPRSLQHRQPQLYLRLAQPSALSLESLFRQLRASTMVDLVEERLLQRNGPTLIFSRPEILCPIALDLILQLRYLIARDLQRL